MLLQTISNDPSAVCFQTLTYAFMLIVNFACMKCIFNNVIACLQRRSLDKVVFILLIIETSLKKFSLITHWNMLSEVLTVEM